MSDKTLQPGDSYTHKDFPEGTMVTVSKSFPSVHVVNPIAGQTVPVTMGKIWEWGLDPAEQIKLVPVLFQGDIYYINPKYLTKVEALEGSNG